ncbi:MAG TPA: alpha-E domain-containing protein, partial [Roseomonas sp.]
MTGEAPRRTTPPLLARSAEDLIWLARYVERVENLARILDVTQVFARDESDGGQWRMVLRINADEARFLELHGEADASTVTGFYLLDRSNPTSIPAAITRAREIARTLRAQIS